MKKLIVAAGLGLAFLFTTAQAGLLVESGTIPTTGASVSTATALTAGVEYKVIVSGSFFIGGPGDRLADAEYYDFTNPQDSNGTDIGVQIDGVSIDWGPYTATHVYETTVMGMGTTIALSYLDTFYGDNQGTLDFVLEELPAEVPVPAALPLMAAGLAGLGVLRKKRVRQS